MELAHDGPSTDDDDDDDDVFRILRAPKRPRDSDLVGGSSKLVKHGDWL
jgi:hypothetical protein